MMMPSSSELEDGWMDGLMSIGSRLCVEGRRREPSQSKLLAGQGGWAANWMPSLASQVLASVPEIARKRRVKITTVTDLRKVE